MDNLERGNGVAWSPGPARQQGTMLPIWTVPPGRKLEGWILSQYAVGVFTHFVQDSEGRGRTRPCTSPTLPCAGCAWNTPRRWKGYVAIQTERTGQVGLAQFTVEAWRSAPSLQQQMETLRGRWLKLWRLGSARNSRMTALVEVRCPVPELLPCPEVERALLRIWSE